MTYIVIFLLGIVAKALLDRVFREFTTDGMLIMPEDSNDLLAVLEQDYDSIRNAKNYITLKVQRTDR